MLDVDRNAERAKSLKVRSVPTFVFFSGGKEVRRARGNLSESQIRRLFRSPDSWF